MSNKKEKELTTAYGSPRLHCHRCGWEGYNSELNVSKHGKACPKCPKHKDIRASLSIIENTEQSQTVNGE